MDSSDSLERESGGDSPPPKFALVKNLISDRSEGIGFLWAISY